MASLHPGNYRLRQDVIVSHPGHTTRIFALDSVWPHKTGWSMLLEPDECRALLLESVLGYDGEGRPLVTKFWRESGFIGFSVPGTDWSDT